MPHAIVSENMVSIVDISRLKSYEKVPHCSQVMEPQSLVEKDTIATAGRKYSMDKP